MTDPRFVGRRYESAPFEVTEASIREFMQAIGDLAQNGELVAPPTYAMVYGSGPMWQLWSDQEVALDVAHLVHAEQSFQFHRPVHPGDRISSEGRITAINERAGMEFVTFELAASDPAGRPVSAATALFIIRKP